MMLVAVAVLLVVVVAAVLNRVHKQDVPSL